MSDTQKIPNGLPPNAKRVFEGVIFDVWQWEQKMFDGTTATFEKVWRCPTAEVIATVENKILLEEQDQPNRIGYVTLPSGMANKSNDILAEAKRELCEETGYESDDWDVFATYGKKGKVLHEVHYFIARNCAKTKEPELDSGEKIEIKLITFDEFLMLSDNPRFWTSPEFIAYLTRVRFDPNVRNDFHKLLFGAQ